MRISFYMKLIAEILKELGADEDKAFTVCPNKLAYFKNVKAVGDLTEEKIVIVCGKKIITVEGEDLFAAEYFQGDMLIKGNVKKVTIE